MFICVLNKNHIHPASWVNTVYSTGGLRWEVLPCQALPRPDYRESPGMTPSAAQTHQVLGALAYLFIS